MPKSRLIKCNKLNVIRHIYAIVMKSEILTLLRISKTKVLPNAILPVDVERTQHHDTERAKSSHTYVTLTSRVSFKPLRQHSRAYATHTVFDATPTLSYVQGHGHSLYVT